MKLLRFLCIGIAAVAASGSLLADNPIVQTMFTTDPAPMVDGNTIYVYTGHDEDNADFFWMNEWRVFSSKDMVNWTDLGVPLSLASFDWADDRAWAPQTVKRNGKYYMYVPVHSKLSNTMSIGVTVADSPAGPFKDAIGGPLADGSWDYIDPTVLIDDDGRAYIYWGNPNIYFAELNPDMISLKTPVRKIEQSVEGFGAPSPDKREKDAKYKDMYTEGPWIMKRDGKYYLLYAAGGVPEHIAYSVSDSPEGPWKYMGEIMPLCDTGSFTNHCGVADFNGHNYFFYHTGKLPGGGGFGRSVAVEEFKYNPDGTFPLIMPTDKGVKPIATFDPYRRNEAETMAFSHGVKSDLNARTGVYVSDIHNGDFIKVANVDFRSGAKKFSATVSSAIRGGIIEVHPDSIGSDPVASVRVPYTGGWEEWKTVTGDVSPSLRGVHDIYFVFKGEKGPRLFNFDYWSFKR